MIKLIMTWNIRGGKETEYLQFLNSEFTQSLLSMNIHPSDAWYAVWGQGPQVLASGVTEDAETMEDALSSDEWREFRDKLGEFVVDFKFKVVEASAVFQL
ncbi:MAG: hypothetical protein A2Y73_06855 [Chloroflexi bacterium RBG_13_56_8]|nr:MAG: hypothetical protein A2Y73_06855 [Chloroflexi bacterium RBG_13_56_8]